MSSKHKFMSEKVNRRERRKKNTQRKKIGVAIRRVDAIKRVQPLLWISNEKYILHICLFLTIYVTFYYQWREKKKLLQLEVWLWKLNADLSNDWTEWFRWLCDSLSEITLCLRPCVSEWMRVCVRVRIEIYEHSEKYFCIWFYDGSLVD